jgi:hypothetical protein
MSLPTDLRKYAADAVAAGRYRDVGKVLAADVGLLRKAEAEVAEFVRLLEDVKAEERGFAT